MPVMCVPGEYCVLIFVPKVGFTHILLATDPVLVVDGVVG